MATPQHTSDQRPFNILVSAAGRRVALVRLLQMTLADMGLSGEVIATDLSLSTAAMQFAARHRTVPPYRDPGCLQYLLGLVRECSVSLIVPTIDPELSFYSEHREAFAREQCRVNVSAPDVIAIGGDKVATHQWLTRHSLPTVRQWAMTDALSAVDLPLPVIIKPRFGSASIGVSVARDRGELEARAGEKDLVVQSMAPGREYTVDAFIDRQGKCRCAVPRLRLEVRAGEVSKGVTVRDRSIIDLAGKAAEALPGAYGVMNIQLFHDERTGKSQIIELNPRFGGGYPLTHEAGAPMIRWLIEDVLELPSSACDDAWREGVVMLRYDEAVFVDAAQAGVSLPHARESK